MSPTQLHQQRAAIYRDICDNIRATDEISFKLLSTVPVMATLGSGALTVLEKSALLADYTSFAVIGLSLLGVLITLGLFRWELRNIQKCNWLISRAAKLERELLNDTQAGMQFAGIASAGHLAATSISEITVSSIFAKPWRWGKTQAEKLIYSAATLVWGVPLAIALHKVLF